MKVLQDGAPVATYDAASKLVIESLMNQGCVFTGEPGVWLPAHAAELERRVHETPDETVGKPFDAKLCQQLEGASREVILLAANLRYLHVLPAFDSKARLRAQRVNSILDMVGETMSEELEAALHPGIVSWGAGNAQAWHQYVFLIRFAAWFSGLDDSTRSGMIHDPMGFKSALWELDAASAQMEREAVLHLVAPDDFDAVFSPDHKRQIARHWSELSGGDTDIDRCILAIRTALTPQFGLGFNWYDPELKEQWFKATPTPSASTASRQAAAPEDGDALEGQPTGAWDGLAAEIHLPAAWLQRCEDLLRDRGQLVFYGPPGTSKTFAALSIANSIAPDPECRDFVQFHPSTSYEDFFEGFRPRVDDQGRMVYELVAGPLARLAARASEYPEQDHVLVIDEINRANLPRALGELLFLMEYRDQEITTLYRVDGSFKLPRNLLLMGTMNTADRSIALIDAAMRRRFHFMAMFPDAPPVDQLLDNWTNANGADHRWPELLRLVNGWLRVDLGGPDLQIGPSHFLRRGLDEERAQMVWEHSIYPYIEDQLFEQPERLTRYRWDRVLAAMEGRTTASAGEGLASVEAEAEADA